MGLRIGLCALLACLGSSHTVLAKPAATVSVSEARELASEAFMYLYPLVTMEITRQQATNMEAGKMPGRGPMNSFSHMRAFPDANFRVVVRPNFDTLYSSAWLDVTKEPVLISMPDSKGRYYLLPVLDMWSDVLGAPGTRTTGNGAQLTAVVPQGWKGSLPKAVTSKIVATTPYVWVIGRVQTNGAKDYEAVHELQDQMKVTPLSQWGKPVQAAKFKFDPKVDMKTAPLEQVDNMKAEEFFALGNRLMKMNKPHLTDWSQLERIARIGVGPDRVFNSKVLSAELQEAIQQGASDGLKLMRDRTTSLGKMANGWMNNTSTMGVYGNDYMKRAIVTMVGLGANQPEDAVYPFGVVDSQGKEFLGGQKYVLHFKANELPPNSAFWSLTLYDEQGFQVANPLNRFSLNSHDGLKLNPDGSMDIYVQPKAPDAERTANWLPSPEKGPISLTMRIYAPKPEVLDGRWDPPVVVRR